MAAKTKEIIPNNLRVLRIIHGDITQEYIALKLNITQGAYSKIERGIIAPSSMTIVKLSKLYKCNVAKMLYLPKEEIIKKFM